MLIRHSVDLLTGDHMWQHPPDWPRNKWIDQLRDNSCLSVRDLWRHAVSREHGGAKMRRPSPAKRPWWWWLFKLHLRLNCVEILEAAVIMLELCLSIVHFLFYWKWSNTILRNYWRTPVSGVEYFDQSVSSRSVCLISLSLFICWTDISRTTWPIYINVFACCPWLWFGPALAVLWYVMYFRFCGWRHICP